MASLGARVGWRRGGRRFVLGRVLGLSGRFLGRLFIASAGQKEGAKQQQAGLHGRRPYASAAKARNTDQLSAYKLQA